jgi:hypothetical protein
MNGQDDIMDLMMPFIIIAALMLALWLGYKSLHVEINTIVLVASKYSLLPFSYFFEDAAKGMAYMDRIDPRSFGFDGLTVIISKTSSYLRWPFSLLLGFLAYRAINSGLDSWNRKLSLSRLMENNVKEYPLIAPAVHLDILSMPQDRGPWRIAEDSINWAVKHKLLIREYKKDKFKRVTSKDLRTIFEHNGALKHRRDRAYDNTGVALDKALAHKEYVAQLGAKLVPLHEMPNYLRGLAAAFIVYGSGQRDRAYDLLGQMSLSYSSPDDYKYKLNTVRSWTIDIGDADEILDEFSEEIEKATSGHNIYTSTWIVELLDFARRKGELAPSRFIWLRPINRTLWYALNQLGGRMPHFEASAVWSHMDAERVLGEAISSPEIKASIVSLEYELTREDWLDMDIDKKNPDKVSARRT